MAILLARVLGKNHCQEPVVAIPIHTRASSLESMIRDCVSVNGVPVPVFFWGWQNAGGPGVPEKEGKGSSNMDTRPPAASLAEKAGRQTPANAVHPELCGSKGT